jgi:penicillin-binding protein 1A
VGFTPEYITLTWVGFDRKQRIRYNGTGGVLAAPIWTDFMKVAHEGFEVPDEESAFPEPTSIVHLAVTSTTGMRAAAFCDMPSYEEVMVPGTEPEHFCYMPREPGIPVLLPEERDGQRRPQDEPIGDDFLF